MPRAIVYPHKVKQMKEEKDRADLHERLEAVLLTPSCRTCLRDFDEAFLAYREKYG